MYCPNCKRYAGKGNDFCKKCGTFIPSQDSEVAKYADYKCSGDKGLDKMPDSRKYTTLSHTESNNAPKILRFPNKQFGFPGTDFREMQQHRQEQGNTSQSGSPVFRKGTSAQKPFPALLIFIFIIVFISFVGPLVANVSEDYENTPVFEDATVYNYYLPGDSILLEPSIASVTTIGSEKVNAFAIKFTGLQSYDGNVLSAPDFTAKGRLSLDGHILLDVYVKNNTLVIEKCDLIIAEHYTIDYIELETEDNYFNITMPDGFTEILFRADGTSEFE